MKFFRNVNFNKHYFINNTEKALTMYESCGNIDS